MPREGKTDAGGVEEAMAALGDDGEEGGLRGAGEAGILFPPLIFRGWMDNADTMT